MAARKQFMNRPTPNARLIALLDETRNMVVTDEVLAAQRISFAYGNASEEAENVTKASVTESAGRIRLSA